MINIITSPDLDYSMHCECCSNSHYKTCKSVVIHSRDKGVERNPYKCVNLCPECLKELQAAIQYELGSGADILTNSTMLRRRAKLELAKVVGQYARKHLVQQLCNDVEPADGFIYGYVLGLSTLADEDGSEPVFIFESDNGSVANVDTFRISFIKEEH